MHRMTIRGIDEELASRIRRLAAQEGISLNRAVLKLLRIGTGIGQSADTANRVGPSLDHLIGTWTSEQADEMQSALDDLEHFKHPSAHP